MLAKAVAAQGSCSFFNCVASSIVSKWRGDSEKLVRCLFDCARVCSPSVVFIDEVDALVANRDGGYFDTNTNSEEWINLIAFTTC